MEIGRYILILLKQPFKSRPVKLERDSISTRVPVCVCMYVYVCPSATSVFGL